MPDDPGHRTTLRADCSRCAGLCCVAPPFAASADFALTKPAGAPCPNLAPDLRCAIHDRLRPAGFPGCVAFDCFGAGQQVTQVTFGGGDWRTTADGGAAMFAVFAVVRDLHELRWYLEEALALPAAAPLHAEVADLLAEVERLGERDAAALRALEVRPLRRRAHELLLEASALARGGAPGRDLSGRDLVGADLRGADLRAAALVGSLLLGADLTGAVLAGADLRGADLRGAALAGADLADALFLHQAQVEAAGGDAGTRLPSSVARPAHWG